MKKTSRNRFSLHFLGNGLSVAVIVFLCVLVLLWRSFFTGLLWRVGAPLLGVGRVVFAPVSFVMANFSTKATLVAENTRLKNELASTAALVADRTLLYQENVNLKTRFGRGPLSGGAAKTRPLLAGVLLGPPGMPYDTLLLDAGSAEGVSVGDAVSAGGATLIGKIGEVHPHTAVALLYSAPGQRYEAMLLLGGSASTSNTKSVPITLEGQGGASLRAEVPAGTLARVGDSVVEPGVAGGFVGRLSFVDAKISESFETLYVTLPANPFELRFVELWKKE